MINTLKLKIASVIAAAALSVAGFFGGSNPVVEPTVGAQVYLPYQGGTGTGTAPNTGGKLLISTSGGVYTPAYLTAGSNITIASSSGGITISSTGGGGGTSNFTGLDFGTIGGTQVKITSQSFDASSFSLSNTASQGNVRINWGAGGVASRSAANTWTAINTFNAGASVSQSFEVIGVASISQTTRIGGGLTGSNKALIVNNGTSTGNIFEAQDGGTAVFTVADGGNATFTGKILAASGGTGAPSITFSGANTTGLFTTGADIWFSVSGANYAVLNATNFRSLVPLSPYVTLGSDLGEVSQVWRNLYVQTIGGSGLSGTTKALQVNNGTSTGNIFEAQDNGTAVFTIFDGGNASLSRAFEIGNYASVGGNIFLGGSQATISSIASMSQVVIQNGVFGAMEFPSNGGIITALDMPVTSVATIGTVESYNFNLDGTSFLNLYSESDGAGGIQAKNFRIQQNASASANFEVTGFASSSLHYGAGLTSCTGSNALQWSFGLFSCAAVSGGSRPASNSLDWDEFVTNMTLDRNHSIASGSGAFALTNRSTLKEWDGTAASPSFTFANDTNLGLYRAGTDILGVTANGSRIASASAGGWEFGGFASASATYVGQGSASLPAYSFNNDRNTGIYRPLADDMIFVTNGANRVEISDTALAAYNNVQFVGVAGSSATQPAFVFASDANTGFFSPGADVVGVAAGGSRIASASTTGWEFTGTASISSKLYLAGLTASTGTPNSICQNGTEVTVNAALTCTVSARDQKTKIAPIDFSALDLVMKLTPENFAYKDQPSRMRFGFIADEVQSVDNRLGDAFDKNGNARSIDLPALTALNTKAIQELAQTKGAVPSKSNGNWGLLGLLGLLGLIPRKRNA